MSVYTAVLLLLLVAFAVVAVLANETDHRARRNPEPEDALDRDLAEMTWEFPRDFPSKNAPAPPPAARDTTTRR